MALPLLLSATSSRITAMFLAGLMATGAAPALAQDSSAQSSEDYLAGLKACQGIRDDSARLSCFDGAVGDIVAATAVGDVQVVDREDLRQTRRSLFGFNVPDLGIFGGGDDQAADELFETTIRSVRYQGRTSVRFTTAEGAVWEMNNVPSRLREIRSGDTVVFKEASLGFFFARINGQTGVKGKRIE